MKLWKRQIVADQPMPVENPSAMNEPPKCTKCQSPMEEGYTLDLGHGNTRQVAQWVSGPPERSIWMGLKTKGKRQREIHTFRCVNCGFLESYAW